MTVHTRQSEGVSPRFKTSIDMFHGLQMIQTTSEGFLGVKNSPTFYPFSIPVEATAQAH